MSAWPPVGEHVPLGALAHARAGDKGDTCNIGVVAWDAALFSVLCEVVTPERVSLHFNHRKPGTVRRYLLPQLNAMNLVIEGVLDGGVNDSLNLDTHGKSLAFHLLKLPVPVPADLRGLLRARQSNSQPVPTRSLR